VKLYDLARNAKISETARVDWEKGLTFLKRHADAGEARAQFICYSVGDSTGLLTPEASELYLQRSGEQGFPQAEFVLADHYQRGHGPTKKDFIQFLGWIRRAADHNYAPAQIELGLMFQGSGGLVANAPESRRWLTLAAQNKTALPAERSSAEKALKQPNNSGDGDAGQKKSAASSKVDMLLATIETGLITKVDEQLTGGAPLNSGGSEFPNWTPLQMAASKGDLLMVQYLVAHGADVRGPDRRGQTALHTVQSDAEIVRFLVAKGAEPNARDISGGTPLHEISRGYDAKHVEITNALLGAGADVNARNDFGETPLVKILKTQADCSILFSLGPAIPSVDALLRAKADVSIRDNEGNDAISVAEDIRRGCSFPRSTPEETDKARVAISSLSRVLGRTRPVQ
jgi:ankyrin repeat protein